MFQRIIVTLICLIILPFLTTLSAEASNPIPDYYHQPGIENFREYQVAGDEFIDPFTGRLRLSYPEIVVPGNGGMDIVISRVYHSIEKAQGYVGQSYLEGRTIYGVGWDMHFGRLYNPNGWLTATTPDGCKINREYSDQNPVLELPDGTRKVLTNSDAGEPYAFITKDLWVATCLDANSSDSPNGGLRVYSPDGMIYTYTWQGKVMVEDSTTVYWLSTVEDQNGNTLTYTYENTHFSGYTLPLRVDASDGRYVTFGYHNYVPGGSNSSSAENNALLGSIEINGQATSGGSSPGGDWTFEYQSMDDHIDSLYLLTGVNGPEGLKWRYQYYNTEDYVDDPDVPGTYTEGLYSVRSVTAPYGSQTVYTYQRLNISAVPSLYVDRTAIASKTVHTQGAGASNSDTYSWTYDFYRTGSSDSDFTAITSPWGYELYEHCGELSLLLSGSDPEELDCTMGTLLRKTTWAIQDPANDDGSFEPQAQATVYRYANARIASQKEKLPSRTNHIVNGTFTQWPTQTVTSRGNIDFATQYYDYDNFGNARLVIEYSGLAGDYYEDDPPDEDDPNARWTSYSFYEAPCGPLDTSCSTDLNLNKWVLHKVADEFTVGDSIYIPGYDYDDPGHYTNISGIERVFDDNGNLIWQSDHHVETDFTYYSTGDLRSVTDARNNSIDYSDYRGGVPQREEHPEGVTLTRVVDLHDLTVTSEKDGLGRQTSYTYDQLHRITGITTPRSDDSNITITYSFAQGERTLTRGGFAETRRYDGLGRETSHSAEGITITKEYDARGSLVFESDPASSGGHEYVYDDLGRLILSQHTSGGSITYDYDDEARTVEVTNENGHSTTVEFTYYGTIEGGQIVDIDAPLSASTALQRDAEGNILHVYQGPFSKSFTYNNHKWVTKARHPERTVDYSYDQVGNLLFEETKGFSGGEESWVGFSYDDLNRITEVEQANGPDITTFTYDKAGNTLSVNKGDIKRSYAYDANNNLTQESLEIDGHTFTIGYTYDQRDNLSSITYPSGNVINYAPDDLGRPTQVGSYVPTVTHHPSGLVASLAYANGTQTSIDLDHRLRPKHIKAEGVFDLSYTYDSVGNVLTIEDAINAANSRSMTYDSLERLIGAEGPWGVGAISYDANGNILSKQMGAEQLSYTYDNDNRLSTITGTQNLTYTYDPLGNTTSNTKHSFAYDDASNLTQVTSRGIEYIYDGNNQRVARKEGGMTTWMVVSKSGHLLYEEEDSGEISREYIRLGSLVVARRDLLHPCRIDSDQDGIPNCVEVELGMDPQDPSDALADYDSDGLSNVTEYELGTDLHNADSDGDGMSDGWEVEQHINPTDPEDASADFDADGLTNVEEYQAGSDPRDSDTDDDQLPDEWEVIYGLDPTDPADADEDLDQDGLTNLGELNAETDPTNADTDSDGLPDGPELMTYGTDPLDPDSDNDIMPDGWEVDNGLNPIYQNDRTSDDDGDLLIARDEYYAGTDPNNADTDGDTLPDGWEYHNGLSATDTTDATEDADGDGLSNLDEYDAGADPQDSDSDDDGLLDGYELLTLGTSPTDPDSDSDDMHDGWEVAEGFDPLSSLDRNQDADSDNATNVQEFWAQTDPRDPSSFPGPGSRLWVFSLPSGSAVQPAVATDGTVYITSDGTLYAMTSGGTVLWAHTTISGDRIESSAPSIGADGTIYYAVGASYGSQEEPALGVYAVSSSGARQWHYPYPAGGMTATPSIDEQGNIIVGTRNRYWSGNALLALSSTGALLWSSYAAGWIHGQAAISSSGDIFVGTAPQGEGLQGRTYGYTSSGECSWMFDVPTYASPAIGANGLVYFSDACGFLRAFTPDGEQDWIYAVDCGGSSGEGGGGEGGGGEGGGGEGRLSSPIRATAAPTAGSGDGPRVAMDPAQRDSPDSGAGGGCYTVGSAGMPATSPVIGADETLYVACTAGFSEVDNTPTGRVHAVYPNGQRRWMIDAPYIPRTAAMAISNDGRLYIAAENDHENFIQAVDTQNGQILWTESQGGIEGGGISAITLGTDGTLYLTRDGVLEALKGDAVGPANSAWPIAGHDAQHTGRFGAAPCSEDADGDGASSCIDCDDSNPAIRPGVTDDCDGIDNDCDSAIDEQPQAIWYPDTDHDGHGDPNRDLHACAPPEGYVGVGDDCDDASAQVHPGLEETCDSSDNDCDTSIDEGFTTLWFQDLDSDGYGSDDVSTISCDTPEGYTSNGGDCDDSTASVNPGIVEVCDAIDNDCDAALDEGLLAQYYEDQDGDGFGDSSTSQLACEAPDGYVLAGGDCRDYDSLAFPGAEELCDMVDNDCNGVVDDSDECVSGGCKSGSEPASPWWGLVLFGLGWRRHSTRPGPRLKTRLSVFKWLLLGLVLPQIILTPQVHADELVEVITYFHHDVLGSPVAATDAQGDVLWQAQYKPYGERIAQPTRPDNETYFTGKQEDPDTGLVDMGARSYDPLAGRFLSVDPAGFNEANIQTFNAYAYANNNPYRFIDPNGESGVTAVGGLIYESTQFVMGNGFNGEAVLGALADGYNGEGNGFASALIEDALTFVPIGAVAGATVKLGRLAKASLHASKGRKSATRIAQGGAKADDWAKLSGQLRDAAKGKGNFGIGRGTSEQANAIGRAWVGNGHKVASDGKTLISADGLRQFRPPSYKPKLGRTQANLERRFVPEGQWQGNAHLDIVQ